VLLSRSSVAPLGYATEGGTQVVENATSDIFSLETETQVELPLLHFSS